MRWQVRAHVYSSLGNKLEMRVLSIVQRVQLLTDGLNDRSRLVRTSCLEMMKVTLLDSESRLSSHVVLGLARSIQG